MRARGAKVTDVVVLVVAADDGVMPQTREAIDHAKAANVPIVVAINKIDKPGVNPDNVKRQLAELSLVPEDRGGQTVMVPVWPRSGRTSISLEMILLFTDILESAPTRSAARRHGAESKLDRGRGPVATVLVQDGHAQRRRQLHCRPGGRQGPRAHRRFVTSDEVGRTGDASGSARPDQPAAAGDPFQTVADAAKARQIATSGQARAKERALGAKGGRLTLESLKEQIAEGGVKELPLIVKADVQGSPRCWPIR